VLLAGDKRKQGVFDQDLSALPRGMKKLGGFQTPLPLYRTETHLCSYQKGGAQSEQ